MPCYPQYPSAGSSGSHRTPASRAIYTSSTEPFTVTIVADFHSEDGFTPLTRHYSATSSTIFASIAARFESSSTVQDALRPYETIVYRAFQVRGHPQDIQLGMTIAENGILLRRRVQGGEHTDADVGVVVRACAGGFDHRGRFVRRGD
ncbi:hypothetical protein TWF696_009445 [Orbilia brochopaga]|uniref:Uncharacterized protein n=1 Tax=Orbilia brochopaga TaxID=3140254 RepID=A0AAV9UBG7_9PEZI